MLPGMQGSRTGQFAGNPSQQGGRGGINGSQQVPPNTFAMPGQMPFGAIQGGPGGFPNGIAFPHALAQVQAQLGRGNQGGRGQMQGMQGVQAVPQQMMALPGMRGRDGRPQYSSQPARGGVGNMNMGMQPGQMGGFSQQNRGPIPPAMGQQNIMQPGAINSGPPNIDAVASAPPGQQKQLLGEALYPKIQVLQPELAGKVTGMLLEMDNAELIAL